MRVKIVLASANAHKARELADAVPVWHVELLDEVDFPEETGSTLHENARAKAELGRLVAEPGAWVIGEDSGLEVDGLGGRPGVRSARFAGPEASDAENVARLLEELAGVTGPGRRARYVSELVCLAPAEKELRARGTLAGRVAGSPRGTGWFGYDPVFVPLGETQTVAELGNEWKARNSHRARAARALYEAVEAAAQGL
jgi:XTP/dITP diphosphohydrolase